MKIKRLLSAFIVLLAIPCLLVLAISMRQSLVSMGHPLLFLMLPFIMALISIPLFILWYRWLIRFGIAENNREPVLLFAFGTVCWIIASWKFPDSTLDFHFHDTYFIVSFVAVCWYITICFAIMGIAYFVFPLLSLKNLNLNLSRFHFWVTYIGVSFLVANWS